MQDTSVIQVDLSAVDHNMAVIRRLVGPDVKLCPIVKADAYGLGAPRLAKRLASAGAAMLAVYTPEQAEELIRATVDVPILILMPIWEIERTDWLYRPMVSGRLHLTVHGGDHLAGLMRIAERFGAVVPLHVEIDTGMSRGGAAIGEAADILHRIASCRWVRLAGLFTHFAESEGTSGSADEQREAFQRLIRDHAALIPPDCIIHAANTFATLRDTRFHFGMVRIGLAWTGFGADSLDGVERLDAARDLKPILSWVSRIVHLKTIPPGSPVGYGGTWRAPPGPRGPSRIALIPAGYADGYPIACSNNGAGTSGAACGREYLEPSPMSGGGRGQGEGFLNHASNGEHRHAPAMVGVRLESPTGWKTTAYAPVVGAVNMDQITIDVTDLPLAGPGESGGVRIGTMVELISADAGAPNHVAALARRAGLIPHALICGLNPRLRRIHFIRAAPGTLTPSPPHPLTPSSSAPAPGPAPGSASPVGAV
jgi:alanine racemase